VGKATEIQDPQYALDAAEEAAKALLGNPPAGQQDSRRVLDWLLRADGTALALVGCWTQIAK
jgi:hypothetical protein